MEDLRIGVVGFGLRRSVALHAHRPGEGSRIVAVLDPAERAHRDAAEKVGPECAAYTSMDEFLAHGLDAVMVVSPDYTHKDITLRTLAAGLPTFCEKPLAISIPDADAILTAARDSGTKLYVGHNMRHMPVVRQMKALIDAGTIGRVRSVWCRHFVGAGGDFYFKDWHADRSLVNTLLLQKGAHDLDVIHWLAGGYTAEVSGMGDLMVYGDITDRRDNSDRLMWDWYSQDNWPPTAQKELNPVVDVEDISLLNLRLDNGVLATYQQCHFTPDYWRNYTVIGDAGRIENIGDSGGDQINIWTSRRSGARTPDHVEVIDRGDGGHGGADPSLVAEFLRFVRDGGATEVSTVAARQAVAVACMGAESIRSGGAPMTVPPLDPELVRYFDRWQE
ncbi:Gfo/Idh/MocA family protein [Tessaracoccus sp. ZS01]|nr:Gfo/Idh/MocA family oxidoreductase [Tessaracoccus sp. ZS01]MCG6568209.1 gfo/Idh/MocA family oxidoreductase [Tessaracoccus sp. ZS01]OMG53452.1 oxidoreductase [Tessaracoccus sp. ZS01]